MYFAHSGKDGRGRPEPLKEHLSLVAQRASGYADFLGASCEARVSGLLHDLGKYSELFLRRLKNEEKGLDHWSAGAYVALQLYQWNAFAGALAIQGHHIGLQHGYPPLLRTELDLEGLSKKHPLSLRLTEKDPRILLERLQGDGLSLPPSIAQSIYHPKTEPVAGMLDIRMLFSALVDADYIETEAHFQGETDGTKHYRPEGPRLEVDKALDILCEHLKNLRQGSEASEQMNTLRDDLLHACFTAAESPPGIFTLSAPTGSGKTLAMLAFALKHAKRHKDTFRHVIMVIPYLTIIEQTARIYREIFQPHFGNHYVLEHHSLAGTREKETRSEQDSEEPSRRTERLLAENWDAPLVITTNVQCLESLFSSSPSSCRKLHRLAGSIILFDEVQTLPPQLAIPTLAALSRLVERYKATVVFSTATQPAFTHLDTKICHYTPTGWKPKEIVSNDLKLFDRSRRTRISFDTNRSYSWEALAKELSHDNNNQVLCIVNLKKHAQQVAELLQKVPGIFHLSTKMCPSHREEVLNKVRSCLDPKSPQPCRLISTQCVEAGVDVDFPVVYRAFGPLEAIAQAAGRCNRNGNLSQPGKVIIFSPEGERLYPPGGYEQAADVTQILLNNSSDGLDINDPNLFERYYRLLYDLVKNTELSPELEDALKRRNFVDTAKNYRLIKQDAINILVSYDDERYNELREQLQKKGCLTGKWQKDARPYTVSLFRPKDDDIVWHFLQPAPLGHE